MKSCVGTTWCRYGVQDSVQLAIDLELRYRGLRAPHKIKFAVSGCARECAEAQGKDVGVIATERGWNLYVGGNGGIDRRMPSCSPRTSTPTTLVRCIDRYLMCYVRTAERLERTALWQRKLPGGIDFVRRVVLDDALGLGAELEADMARHVASYECEWSATLDDPERLSRFVSFVNAPEPDPTITRSRSAASACRQVPMTTIEEVGARLQARLGAGLRARQLTPDRGVAALVDGRQVAVFVLSSGDLHTVDNIDPCSGAAVPSRARRRRRGRRHRRVTAVQAALRPGDRADASTPRSSQLAVHSADVVDGVVLVRLTAGCGVTVVG